MAAYTASIMEALAELFLVRHAVFYVLLPLAVCPLAAAIGLRSLLIWRDYREGWRLFWLILGISALGAGAWASHFIAMLGWRPDLVLGFSGWRTMLSGAIALAGIGPPLFFAARCRSMRANVASGIVSGAAIATMHVVGVDGVTGCVTRQGPTALAVATAGGTLLIVAALHVLRRWRGGRTAVAALLISLAIATIHFGSIAGTTALPGNPLTVADLPREALSPLLVFATIVMLAAFSVVAYAQSRNEAQRQQLGAIVTNTSNGVLLLDTAGRITWANPAFTGHTGFRESDVLGTQPTESLIGPSTNPPSRSLLETALARSHQCETEVSLTTRRGEEIWVQVALSQLPDYAGDVRGQVMMLNDMTEIRQREADLAAARDSAERASRVKSEFISIMSHELRTPLNGILGFASLLALGDLDDRQKQQIGMIAQSGERLLQVLNDILEFTEDHDTTPACEPFAPEALLKAVCRQIGPMAAARGLMLRCAAEPGLQPVIWGDGEALQRVLVRLADNAVKFTETGKVKISLRPDPTDATTLLAEVKDTGVGIPEDAAAALFDGFTQADSSATRRFGGVGLGLALCQRGVHRMGGTLTHLPRAGGGSNFRVTLPGLLKTCDEVAPLSRRAVRA
jgi:PAS domain S-box-containing protein